MQTIMYKHLCDDQHPADNSGGDLYTSLNAIASRMRSRSGSSCRKKINGLPAGLTCSTFYFAITAHRASFGPLRSGYLQWDRYCE